MSEPLLPTDLSAHEWVKHLFGVRFAAKHYDPERVVSDEDFAVILEAGRLAPSSMGLEPWRFVRLKDEETIAEIMPFCWGGADKIGVASHLVLFLGRKAAAFAPNSDYLKHMFNDVQQYPAEMQSARYERMQSFFAEDQELANDRNYFDWVGKQVYLALGQMMTAATILGVDSTPLEGYHQRQVEEVLVRRGVYDPTEFGLVVMATFGYASVPGRPKTRSALSEVYQEF